VTVTCEMAAQGLTALARRGLLAAPVQNRLTVAGREVAQGFAVGLKFGQILLGLNDEGIIRGFRF